MASMISATESANFVELFNLYSVGEQKTTFEDFIKAWCYNEVTHLEDGLEDVKTMKAIIQKAMDAEFVFEMMQTHRCE